MFTDWLEFQKAYKREEWGCMVFSLADGLRAAAGDPAVINLDGKSDPGQSSCKRNCRNVPFVK